MEDMNKLLNSSKKRYIESYESYLQNVLPYIKNNDNKWMYNILDGTSENDRIIYQDNDFILLPDYKWDAINVNELYYLAIVKDKSIKSIRDLNDSHIKLLENIYKNGLQTITKKYKFIKSEINVYIHYHPSYWHFHVHFSLVKNNHITIMNHSHSLIEVINNIKVMGNYYQIVSIEVLRNKKIFN